MKLCIAILNKQKCLFAKTEDRGLKQVLSKGWCQWREEDIVKGYRIVNMVEILCTHV
jgi:hypothetical protein